MLGNVKTSMATRIMKLMNLMLGMKTFASQLLCVFVQIFLLNNSLLS